MAKKIMRHASALKAHRKSLVLRDKNVRVRSQVRTLTAKVLADIKAKNVEAAKKGFIAAQSAWHKAAKTGIFNKNAAARKISRMASRLAALAKS
jgi:small subunit ribosomal protein S20